jgi:anaerobic magnesium-protoporphyrin IX monomethyl ester cyclase
MKFLLINPPFLPKYSRSSRSPAVTKSGTIYYPIWLSHAAGLLEQKGNEVLLIDFPAECKTLADYKDKIVRFNPDIIVFDTSTPSIESDTGYLGEMKSWFKDNKSGVLVGTHPTAKVKETFGLNDAIDVIARGEYDWTLCELAENISDLSKVKGISYRNNGVVFDNPDRPYSEALDEVPFVSGVYKKHLDINNYFYAHCQNPVISIFAGRGCPNRCYYCVYPQVMFGHKYRHRSVKHFVDELEFIRKEFKDVKEVLIDDDNFTADQEFVEEVCDEIIKRGLKITWTAEVRVELKYGIMMKMRAAGCRLLVAGFESGDQKILDSINKNATLEQAAEFTRSAKKVGLRVHGCFMAGNRGEDRASLGKTLALALKMTLDTAQFFPLMIYPGTEAYKWAEESKFIGAKRYRDWLTAEGMHSCVIDTDKLTARELVDFCDKARRKFYIRPKYLAYKLYDVARNPKEIGRTLRSGIKLFEHLFRKHR